MKENTMPEMSFYKKYWEFFLILAIAILLIIAFTIGAASALWVQIFMSAIMIEIILCARLLCKRHPDLSDFTWLFSDQL